MKDSDCRKKKRLEDQITRAAKFRRSNSSIALRHTTLSGPGGKGKTGRDHLPMLLLLISSHSSWTEGEGLRGTRLYSFPQVTSHFRGQILVNWRCPQSCPTPCGSNSLRLIPSLSSHLGFLYLVDIPFYIHLKTLPSSRKNLVDYIPCWTSNPSKIIAKGQT